MGYMMDDYMRIGGAIGRDETIIKIMPKRFFGNLTKCLNEKVTVLNMQMFKFCATNCR